jgi:hypothetical protein
MRTLLHNITAVFVALLVVIATSGMNVYMHYCACDHLYSATLLPGESYCDHGVISGASCCQLNEKERDCCNEYALTCAIHKHATGCCSTSQLFLKISSDIDANFSKISLKIYATSGLTDPNIEPATDPITVKNIRCALVDPVPFYGKTLLTFLHQLRIDTPVS